MIIVPVIDLLQGQAVHAQFGQRNRYRPLDTPLCRAGEVLPLVQHFVEDWDFHHLYIADLDAITRHGDNRPLLVEICRRYPQLQLWLDAGFSCPADIVALREQLDVRCVAGSESWISDAPTPAGCLLSVDSDENGPRDPSGICADDRRRAEELILMNLARVGSQQGPDLGLLAHWQQMAPQAVLYAAGGVRNSADLQTLRNAGAAGVLLASALHTGHLSPADIRV